MTTIKPHRYHTLVAVYQELERLDEADNATLRRVLHSDEPHIRHALHTLREWGVAKVRRIGPRRGAYWEITDEPLPSLEDATIAGVHSSRCGVYDHRALTRACRELSCAPAVS